MTCVICSHPLTGRQTRYCAKRACRNRGLYLQQKGSGYRRRYMQSDAYRSAQRQRGIHRAVTRVCVGCDETFNVAIAHRQQEYCSRGCAQRIRATTVPVEHPARWFGESCAVAYRNCRWCDRLIVVGDNRGRSCCSSACRERVKAERRRSRETAHPRDSWSWTQFMRLVELFEWRCAYCARPFVEQPDPDHVIPVSRGGRNRIANILPACRSCNSSKCDLSLEEWNQRRLAAGREPRLTEWSPSDHRFFHLVDVLSVVGSS